MIKQNILELNPTNFIRIDFVEFDTILPNFSKHAKYLIPEYGRKHNILRFRMANLKGIYCQIPSIAMKRANERCEKYMSRKNPDRKPIEVMTDSGMFNYTILDIHFLRMYSLALIKERINLIGSI